MRPPLRAAPRMRRFLLSLIPDETYMRLSPRSSFDVKTKGYTQNSLSRYSLIGDRGALSFRCGGVIRSESPRGPTASREVYSTVKRLPLPQRECDTDRNDHANDHFLIAIPVHTVERHVHRSSDRCRHPRKRMRRVLIAKSCVEEIETLGIPTGDGRPSGRENVGAASMSGDDLLALQLAPRCLQLATQL